MSIFKEKKFHNSIQPTKFELGTGKSVNLFLQCEDIFPEFFHTDGGPFCAETSPGCYPTSAMGPPEQNDRYNLRSMFYSSSSEAKLSLFSLDLGSDLS
jgi:hypothetical protein